MAGIYIPGMEMPVGKKTITIFSDGRVYEHHGERLWGHGEDCIPWQAIPVPDHGRLIDADEHNKALEKHRNTYAQDTELPWGITLDAFEWELAQAPTILPGDKEETS